jgi:O-antigen/teichoic acid export membrane protein/thiamine kinase-like enzyme
MIFWIFAARNYTTEVVGLNSAAISTMIFLANLSQFQLVNALNRFLPRAGRATKGIILSAYLISAGTALFASLIFVLGLNLWSPELGVLRSSPYFTLWFILSTMAWVIFVLQDGAFVGLRQATWIPVENLIFAASKILLLVAFATLIPQYGVFASWTVPIILLLLPVNMLIFWRLVPRHVEATKDDADHFSIRHMGKYVTGDYFSSLIWMGTTNLLPLMVISLAGATANAYFYLSWVIAYTLYLVSRNMGMSFIAEASTDQTKLAIYGYRTLVQTARIVLPAVFVIVLFAPNILRLFGEDYSAEGTLLLRLLALSAVPYILTSLFVSIVRVQRRMVAMVIVLGALCVMVLSLSYILLGLYGITGVGIAWLVGQTAIAIVLLFTQLRMIFLTNLDLSYLLRIMAQPRSWWWRVIDRRKMMQANAMYQEILPTLNAPTISSSPEIWKALQVHHTVSDMTVVKLGPPGGVGAAILNLPQSEYASKSAQQHLSVVETLKTDERLGTWRNLLPQTIAAGEINAQTYRVDMMIPGRTAQELLSVPDNIATVQKRAATVINELHLRTSSLKMVSETLFSEWVDEPIHLIRELLNPQSLLSDGHGALGRVYAELRETLLGRNLTLSWVHGDYWPGNILMLPEDLTVTGILDWEAARADDLPLLDLLNLLLSTRVIVERKELGSVLRDLLLEDNWSHHENILLDAAKLAMTGDHLETRDMLLLYWLGHVGSNLNKSKRYSKNQIWIAKNVEAVLECL